MTLTIAGRQFFKRAFKPEAFTKALRWHDTAAVAKILRDHPQAANWTAEDGRSALNIAIGAQSAEAALLLIENGADIEHANPGCSGMTPLIEAIMFNEYDVAEALVRKGADVNRRDSLDQTPFFMATGQDHVPTMALLFSKGADINAVCDDFTPLMLAAMGTKAGAVAWLLRQGADIGLRKANGVTAEQLARDSDIRKLLEAAKKSYDVAHAPETRAREAAERLRREEEQRREKAEAIVAIGREMLEGTKTLIQVPRVLKLKQGALRR